ncbi:MAG: T9SS type A sorting domain-containing protein [Bacteroidota bacterium]
MKKPALLALVCAVLALVLFPSSGLAQSFAIPMSVFDDSGNGRTLAFGYEPGANPCIKPVPDTVAPYFEAELPPVPPTTVFDARFTTVVLDEGCFGAGSLVDIRPISGPGQSDSFYVTVQIADAFPVHLTWPGGLGASFTSLRMIDATSLGVLPPPFGYNIDMIAVQSFDLIATADVNFYIVAQPIYVPPIPFFFATWNAVDLFDENPLKLGKSNKPAKRAKFGKPILAENFPNVSNMLSELVARGGFAFNTVESDQAGGLVVGTGSMFLKDPVKGKWAPVKDSAAVRCWVRIGKWDPVKNIGKDYKGIQKTVRDKTGWHIGIARGLDSTLNPGDEGRKALVKQQKKVVPKKHSNRLYAELVALKVNITASAMGITPAGLGELVFERNGHPYDEWALTRITNRLDTVMTYWYFIGGNGGGEWDSAYTAVSLINEAFRGALDTAQFNQYDLLEEPLPLLLKGVVDLMDVSYLKLPVPFVPNRIIPANNLTECPDDFEDGEFEEMEEAGVPVAMKVYQNYPNPFNPTTSINFRLMNPALITVGVYDLLGREVATLAQGEEFEEGYQTIEFAAAGLASGVYFYRVTGEDVDTGEQLMPSVGKMMLLK